jgi:hypothetical protein
MIWWISLPDDAGLHLKNMLYGVITSICLARYAVSGDVEAGEELHIPGQYSRTVWVQKAGLLPDRAVPAEEFDNPCWLARQLCFE